MSKSSAAERQKYGSDYGAIKSLVSRSAPETRSTTDLTATERANLEIYLRYKNSKPQDRPLYQTENFKIHRRGFMHLPELRGTPGKELDHGALEGRFDEMEDIIVKGDRLWSVFTVKARHVGMLYGKAGTGKLLEITEMCVLRFDAGKISEAWFFGDELGICLQIGIEVAIEPERNLT